ncbi:MAG TPA: L,D-transpeptidase family protein [Verrucomicrobiae bacterium]|jgi:D-alanyl-D-alanine dipeptidase
MWRQIRAASVLAFLPFCLNAQPTEPGGFLEMAAPSIQMVAVTTKDWTATEGELRRFSRTEQGWQQTGSLVPVKVVVGRAGLGWGLGMTNPPVSDDPQKKEGDGRSPAGVFPLTYAFGYAAPADVPEIKLPYIQCTKSVECVDDPNSAYYNIIKDRNTVANPDWKSSEKMLMDDGEYKLGIFVAHNSSPAVPGAGSCVFMHVWKAPGHPTSGCTAMRLGDLETLLGWLDPRAHPILVQLPRKQYLENRRAWRLPAIQFE